MKAKKLFKKLKYQLIKEDDYKIEYYKEYYVDDYETVENYITFNLLAETVEIDAELCIEELQAINKQVEELGWYE